MPDYYMDMEQRRLSAEGARIDQEEARRRDALDAERRREEREREEQREADAADPGVQRLLRETEERRRTAAAEAKAERVRADAERKARADAELRDFYEAELRIWSALGNPASTFDSEKWPEVLQRRHTGQTAAQDAERQRRLETGRVF